MLTVYSAHGSPGASTTAMYLAAQWASSGTEVLLIEADPGGGSLSHHLGIQFTPGSASFVASGLQVRAGNLIDHSQDVLFNNLHVMSSTSSPTGAREIVRWWDERAGELRAIAEGEMAVIIDGGRITADSVATNLTAHAAGVIAVARGDSSPTTLEHIGTLLSAEEADGVERCVVTVGDSPLSDEEWREKCGIVCAGSIKEFAEVTGDLTAFLNRNKRKYKKWRVSLEEIAEKLLPYAKPPASGSSRSRRPAAAAEEPPAKEEPAPPPPPAVEEPAPAAPAPAAEPHGHGAAHEVHDEAPMAGTYAEVPPQPDPYRGAPAEAYGQAPPPADDPYYRTASASPYATAPPPAYQQYPPEGQPAYFEPPPAPPEHVYNEAPLPVYQPPPEGHAPPQPQQPDYRMPPELLSAYQQQGVAPPWAPPLQEQSPYPQQAYQPHPELPPPYQQQQPPGPGPGQQPPHEAPAAYQQQGQQPPHEAPAAYQQQRYEPPRAGQPAYQPQPVQPSHQMSRESAPAPQSAAYHPQPQPQQPVYRAPQQAPQVPAPSQPVPPAAAPPAPTAHDEAPSPQPDLAPSGSFRDWATRLHDQAPHGTPNSGHGGAS